MADAELESRALALLTGRPAAEKEPGDAARRIAVEFHRYTVPQVERAYHECGCNSTLTRAWLAFCAMVGRADPAVPTFAPPRASAPVPRAAQQLTLLPT